MFGFSVKACAYSRDRALLEASVLFAPCLFCGELSIGKQDCTERTLCAQWQSPLPGWINKVSCVVFMEEQLCGCVPEGLLLITFVCDGGGRSDPGPRLDSALLLLGHTLC